jgi:acetoin utilization protein AcuB
MYVEELMTRNPKAVQATASVGDVMGILEELEIRHIPILDGRALVGMISDRDLRPIALEVIGSENTGRPLPQSLNRPISALMSGDVLSVPMGTEVNEIIDLMLEYRIGAVPIVDGETTDLVGIVSYVDILRELGDNLG